MEVNQHRTWAEIDLGAIEHNYRVICEQAQAPVLCVVKADAYGHGAVQVAKRLEKMDAPYFAVATIPEGVELREAGIETPILILGYVDEKDMDTAVQYGITVPVYDRETAELISAAAERTGKPVTVHYKLDTGMTRLGFPSWECEQTVQDILACSKLPGLISEGIFTHFAVADVPSGEAYTELQYKRFSDVCEGLQAAGLDLPLRHCANSGAIQTGYDHQLWPHLRDGRADPYGGYLNGIRGRLSAYRLGQGAGAARRRESARARPHLHGYVHGAYSGGRRRTSR